MALLQWHDNPRPRSNPSPVTGVLRAGLLAAAMACGGRGEIHADRPPLSQAGDVARARSLTGSRHDLPARPEALALARSLEDRAVREGAGARAADLYALAGGLAERIWRIAGDPQDGSWAIALYRSASRDPRTVGACDAAVRAGRLAGELAHDASAAYVDLAEARRRFAGLPAPSALAAAGCLAGVDRALAALVAFRPPVHGGEPPQTDPASAATPTAQSATAPRIVRVDAWPGRDSTRVVIALDRPAPYRSGDEVVDGTTAPRTFVDLDGVDLGSAAPETAEAGIVTRIRAEATSTGSRVVLDLDGQAWRRTFYMVEPYRIVVDVARHAPFADRGLREVSRVVLDAGHGGRDSGAVGQAGTVEKDVTLDIGKRAAQILQSQGLSVLLTRDDDRFVSLEERTARANAFSADLFVSIHCNASEGRSPHGVETFVLDTTRDEVAAKIAARENATTRAASAELASMLSSMRLADQAQRSVRFARLLERSALAALRMTYADVVDGGVHPAGFYVLIGARMPSALFESGYISNGIEEQRLNTPEYRQLLADAIVNAVKAYREGR